VLRFTLFNHHHSSGQKFIKYEWNPSEQTNGEDLDDDDDDELREVESTIYA